MRTETAKTAETAETESVLQVETQAALHNQCHKCRQCNLGPVSMELESTEGSDSDKESRGGGERNTHANNDMDVMGTVWHVSSADPRPKGEARTWKDLQEQLKDDIIDAHKQRARLTKINQLLLLRNFTTLHTKGIS